MPPIGSPRDACQNLIDGFLEAGSIQFPAGAIVPARESREGLDVLVKNVGACDTSLTFSIAGRADTADATRANLELGKSRAAFIADFLSASGIESGRLSAIGYGPDAADQANDSNDTRSDSRRIKITVLERSE
jgi:outer membrane protein OmpA-like peptidoglycan-associated protein